MKHINIFHQTNECTPTVQGEKKNKVTMKNNRRRWKYLNCRSRLWSLTAENVYTTSGPIDLENSIHGVSSSSIWETWKSFYQVDYTVKRWRITRNSSHFMLKEALPAMKKSNRSWDYLLWYLYGWIKIKGLVFHTQPFISTQFLWDISYYFTNICRR